MPRDVYPQSCLISKSHGQRLIDQKQARPAWWQMGKFTTLKRTQHVVCLACISLPPTRHINIRDTLDRAATPGPRESGYNYVLPGARRP